MYADPRIAQFVSEHFVPVRVHVRDNAEEFRRLGERFGAHWTPTTLVLDPAGQERHRIEGFLPAEDFIAQLAIGHGQAAFARGDFEEAARQFGEVTERHPASDAAPEARYWQGVAEYKKTGNAAALADTARDLRERHGASSWAKKASVWTPAET